MKKCWYCIFFVPNLIGTNRGECRRYAPTGIDQHVIGRNGDQTLVFAQIADGVIESCGDYSPNPGTVPDPI